VSAPYAASFLTCGVKSSAADLVAQTKAPAEDGNTQRSINLQRNVAYILYGGLYLGCGLHFIYGSVYPFLFGSGTDVATVAAEVAFDNLVLSPFLTFPLAYVAKAFVSGEPVPSGIARYIGDVKNRGLLTKAWLLWVPVQSLTFSVVPEHLRIVFIASVSFFWLILLSSLESAGTLTDADGEECILVDGYSCDLDFEEK